MEFAIYHTERDGNCFTGRDHVYGFLQFTEFKKAILKGRVCIYSRIKI